jgi:transporter family protein
MVWLLYACVSAVTAALTAILAKIGIEGVPSTLATAIRTIVVLVFVWTMVLVSGEHRAMASISRRSLIFLFSSGLAAGVSWLA